MPEPSARLAAKNAWLRTCKLLFPFRPRRWLTLYFGQRMKRYDADPGVAEMRRIRPYYRGTRILTSAGIVLVLLAFVIPFCVVFVDWGTFVIILVAYALLFLFSSLAGMVVQSAMDAILALQHERKLSFGAAVKAFGSVAAANPDLALGYMSIKMAVDFSLSTLALALFLPALLGAMALMVYVTDAVQDGIDLGTGPYLGLGAVAALAALGFAAVLLITVPAAAFYGYYTEEIIRYVKEAYPEAAHAEKAG